MNYEANKSVWCLKKIKSDQCLTLVGYFDRLEFYILMKKCSFNLKRMNQFKSILGMIMWRILIFSIAAQIVRWVLESKNVEKTKYKMQVCT